MVGYVMATCRSLKCSYMEMFEIDEEDDVAFDTMSEYLADQERCHLDLEVEVLGVKE